MNKYFPNLEIIILRYLDLNSKTNVKNLINICKELKNLKIIYISISKKIKSLKVLNKLIEEIPQIVIRCEYFNYKYPDIWYNNDIDPMIFYGKSIDISEIYSSDFYSEFYFKGLYFENWIPNFDFIKNNYNKFYTKNLYLSKINFNNQLIEIFKSLKNIKAIILKNIRFETGSFHDFIDHFLYDIENLKIYNCEIHKNELEIIKKIKYLRILNILFIKELENENFEALFGKINEFEFQELKILNYISYNKREKSRFNMKNKGVEIRLYKIKENFDINRDSEGILLNEV